MPGFSTSWLCCSRISRIGMLIGALTAFCVGCSKKKEADEGMAGSKVSLPTAAEKAPTLISTKIDTLTFPKLPEMPIPEDNPQSDAKIALGRRLFFEKRLSVDGGLSCYSCHQNEQGGGGKEPLAIGANQKQLTRHSPVIFNAGHLSKLYWDGRADSLEAQAKGAWGGANMGVGSENLDKKASEISALPEYRAAFAEVFGSQTKIGAEHVAQAIAAFERTLECKDTAYDKFAAGDKSALSEEQKVGLDLFMGKAMCTACHSPPFFSSAYTKNSAFFNVGVGTKDVAEDQVDVGRMKVTEDEKDWAAFKVPSLRNVTRSAPYFHDGSAATLEEAVRFMASGGHDNKNKNPLMSDKKLTDSEIQSLISFLSALECKETIEAPPQ